MNQIKRIQVKTNCNCSKQQTILELPFPIQFEHLPILTAHNYIENKAYTRIGIVYVEDTGLIAIIPVGSNRMQIKCKTAACEEKITRLEEILLMLKS